jgi:hypothetical protein
MMNEVGNSTEQWDNPPETMKQKRGEFLFTIIALSWISQGSAAASTLFTMLSGRGQLEKTNELLSKASSQEAEAEWVNTMISTGKGFIDVFLDNFYNISLLNLLVVMTGAFGVYLMYKLKKIGFVFYIAYCAMELGVLQYYFGHLSMTIFSLLSTGLVSVLFIILYSVNLKRMTE